MMQWIPLTVSEHSSPVVIEEYGACLRLFVNHAREDMAQQINLYLFKIQKRLEIRTNFLHRKDWQGTSLGRLAEGEIELNEKYIATGKTFFFLHSPMLVKESQYCKDFHKTIGSYGCFQSLDAAMAFAEKEFVHMFGQILASSSAGSASPLSVHHPSQAAMV